MVEGRVRTAHCVATLLWASPESTTPGSRERACSATGTWLLFEGGGGQRGRRRLEQATLQRTEAHGLPFPFPMGENCGAVINSWFSFASWLEQQLLGNGSNWRLSISGQGLALLWGSQ